MKKIGIKSIILTITLTFTLVLAGCCPQKTESLINNGSSIKDIYEICIKVNKALDYGIAVSDNINDVLSDGIGHCGDFAFLLAYELLNKGYNAYIVTIYSTY